MGAYYAGDDVMRRGPVVAPLSESDTLTVEAVKLAGQLMWNVLDELGPSREVSLAKTKLEEAVMWAVKGITA